ncbi:MAG TPA: cupin domain-containing protein [Haliangiales bacterium]|nr:cupin domain-containing protein [Haliangiales bacterium]
MSRPTDGPPDDLPDVVPDVLPDILDDEALVALALALPPETPPPELRARVLAALPRAARFDAFVERIARMIDLGADAVRGLLGRIDGAGWEPGPPPARLLHLPYGPALAGVDVGFVHLPAGAAFPRHRHLGEERVLVLQGAYLDSDGTVVRRGDTAHMAAGSAHAFVALPGPDLVYLVVLEKGVDIEGFGTITVG